jgi:hypothetical protein
MRSSSAVLALALSACSVTGPDTVPASTPNEAYIIETSHRFASEMGTWVEPELTDEVLLVEARDGSGDMVPAAGWVPHKGKSHTIYYWRPWVVGATHAQMDVLARHEVEHVACQCTLGERTWGSSENDAVAGTGGEE